MRTVQLADRTYAVGLWWQVRSGGPAAKKAMLRLARETAQGFETEHYNCVALRAHQFGLGRSSAPLPAKTCSLAAALRPLGSHDAFLGIFCLDNGLEELWWVCGVVRGMIAADGDAIFSTQEEAKAAADSLRLLFEEVGSVVEFHTPAESKEYLAPLLWPETGLTPLHPDAGQRKQFTWFGLLGLALLGCVCAGYWLYQQHAEAQELARQKVLQAKREAQKKDQLAHPERYFKKVWISAPTPKSAGEQCTREMLSLQLFDNAWRLEELICQPSSSLQISWAHTKGADFHAMPANARLISPQITRSQSSLAKLPARPSSSALLTKEQATAALYQVTQNVSGHLTLMWDAPEQFKVDDKTTVFAPWQRGKFDLNGIPMQAVLSPDLFMALESPGAMIVTVTCKNSIWNIKGYIYVAVSSK